MLDRGALPDNQGQCSAVMMGEESGGGFRSVEISRKINPVLMVMLEAVVECLAQLLRKRQKLLSKRWQFA